MALSLGAALGLAGGTSLISGITNYLTGKSMMDEQSKYAKEMFDYQWNKAYSPQAQVKNMAAAGINPAAQLGSHSVLAGSPQASMPSMPSGQYGITGLSDLSSYIAANAQDKKTGADVNNTNQDTELKKIQTDAEAWKLNLAKQFGSDKMAADLALAQQNVRLAELSGDEKRKDIAIKSWTEAKEKAMSQCAEKNRDILQKELDNKDTELKLRNEESRQRAAASKASAAESYSHAENLRADTETKEVFNKFYKDRRYQHSFMSQVVEQGREAVSRRLCTDRQAEQLEYMVEQAAYATDMQEFTYWSNQVNGFVNTLGQAASQFYGAGALRELIKLRQGQQQPSLQSADGYYMQDGLLFKQK